MTEYHPTTQAALERADYVDAENGRLLRRRVAADIVDLLVTDRLVDSDADPGLVELRGMSTRDICERLIGLWDPDFGTVIAQELAPDGRVQIHLDGNKETPTRRVLCAARVQREDQDGQMRGVIVRFVATDGAPDTIMECALVNPGRRQVNAAAKLRSRGEMVSIRIPELAPRITAFRAAHAEELRLAALGAPVAIAAPDAKP
jgi:hypothetical protein